MRKELVVVCGRNAAGLVVEGNALFEKLNKKEVVEPTRLENFNFRDEMMKKRRQIILSKYAKHFEEVNNIESGLMEKFKKAIIDEPFKEQHVIIGQIDTVMSEKEFNGGFKEFVEKIAVRGREHWEEKGIEFKLTMEDNKDPNRGYINIRFYLEYKLNLTMDINDILA